MLKAQGLEYEESGRGEPVLLIHGGHVADGFVPLMGEAVLADRYRLIRYRRRGYAGSPPVSGPFSVEEQAQDALALLAHLGVERTHVVGHSYGGAIALQLAIDAPRLVHSLVLLEPAVLAADAAAAFFEAVKPILDVYRSGDVAGAIDLFMGAAGAADWRSAVEANIPRAARQAEKDAATSFEIEIPALAEPLLDGAQLPRISQPILYALGNESGPIFEAARQHFQSMVTGAEGVMLGGVNHLMQMRNPMSIAEAIASFLDRHPM
jgi:pimeloyl-ACP methyl ester carboxylesterase